MVTSTPERINEMKRFKLRKGDVIVYPVTTKENFEEITGGNSPYLLQEKFGDKRAFGICPACENPVQIIGLYKKIENNSIHPYAKHYNRDAKIAKHNEYTYRFCPYAIHMYNTQQEEYEIKEQISELEFNIYYTLRNNFDAVIYLLEQISGLYMSKKHIKEALQQYIGCEGHLYYGSTIYNIPWLLLYIYTMPARPCYGRIIKKDSFIYNMFLQVPNIVFEDCEKLPGYVLVKGKNGKYIDYCFSFNQHRRTIIDDEVSENVTLTVTSCSLQSQDNPAGFIKLKDNKIYINETRFPNLLCSEKMKEYRKTKKNQDLLRMAEELMPDIEKPEN